MKRVMFATKAWSKDYQKFLSGALERKVAAIGYPFDNQVLILNNGVPEGIEGIRAKQTGNVYGDGELAAVEAAKDYDYLCFVEGDCLTTGGDWVTPAIKILEHNPRVAVVSPASDVNTWHDERGNDHYMSDHAWIVRVKEFSNPEIYKYPGVDPDYPDYGGNSFEHMVGKYLKATGRYRRILTDFYISHPAY